ncbi:25134_t:CDS:2 [Gigaspora rosea]|nr:25134_t:CDS:2 [Gigaspora rosea]
MSITGTSENKRKRKRSRWDQPGSTTTKETLTTPSLDSLSNFGTDNNTGETEISQLVPSTNQSTTPTLATNAQPISQQIYTTADKRKFVKYSDTYKPGMVRVGSKWVYPEDEITDGGTWEHKKRAEEMKKTAGSGLGKTGEGIAAPINKADTRPANAGLGQTKPEGVDEEDDEFEIYRKRMMLAYRFRPNPLVCELISIFAS